MKQAMRGTLDYISDLFRRGHNNEKKQLLTVELKVRMDCEGCEHKVKKALSSMKGVERVEMNMKQQKVSVSGFVEASKVLKRAQSTGNKAELWPYVHYSLVSHSDALQAYDKNAPPGFVLKVEAGTAANAYRQEDHLTNLFSDENPNACSVM